MPTQVTTFCVDTQSTGVQTPTLGELASGKNRWVRTRHLSIASSGVTATLITVLLVLNSIEKRDLSAPGTEATCIEDVCIKKCDLIPFCVVLTNASKHVFLFNYELLYLKNVLWRPQMPNCVGINCFVNPKSTLCRFNHMFAGVSVCFDDNLLLTAVGLSDAYTNAHLVVNGTAFKSMYNKLMYM